MGRSVNANNPRRRNPFLPNVTDAASSVSVCRFCVGRLTPRMTGVRRRKAADRASWNSWRVRQWSGRLP